MFSEDRKSNMKHIKSIRKFESKEYNNRHLSNDVIEMLDHVLYSGAGQSDYEVDENGEISIFGDFDLELYSIVGETQLSKGNRRIIKTLGKSTFKLVEGDVRITAPIEKLPNIKKATGDIVLKNCDFLTSLDGLPRFFEKNIEISGCSKLESLIGFPESLLGAESSDDYIKITSLPELKSLEGLPKRFQGKLVLEYTPRFDKERGEFKKIDSLKGLPKKLKTLQISELNYENFWGFPEEVTSLVESYTYNCFGDKFPYEGEGVEDLANSKIGAFECCTFKIEKGNWNPIGWLEKINELHQASKTDSDYGNMKEYRNKGIKFLLRLIGGSKGLSDLIESNPGRSILLLKELKDNPIIKDVIENLEISDRNRKDLEMTKGLSDLGF